MRFRLLFFGASTIGMAAAVATVSGGSSAEAVLTPLTDAPFKGSSSVDAVYNRLGQERNIRTCGDCRKACMVRPRTWWCVCEDQLCNATPRQNDVDHVNNLESSIIAPEQARTLVSPVKVVEEALANIKGNSECYPCVVALCRMPLQSMCMYCALHCSASDRSVVLGGNVTLGEIISHASDEHFVSTTMPLSDHEVDSLGCAACWAYCIPIGGVACTACDKCAAFGESHGDSSKIGSIQGPENIALDVIARQQLT